MPIVRYTTLLVFAKLRNPNQFKIIHPPVHFASGVSSRALKRVRCGPFHHEFWCIFCSLTLTREHRGGQDTYHFGLYDMARW